MIYVVMALVVFLIVIVVHLLLSRQFKAKDHGIGLFIFVATVGLMIVWILFDCIAFIHSPQFLKSTATMMYVMLLPLYVIFFRSVNQMSPLSKIRQVLEQKPRATYEELLFEIEKEQFIEHALNALSKNGQLRKKDGKYSLTAKGKFVAFFAKMDQSFFKRNKGV